MLLVCNCLIVLLIVLFTSILSGVSLVVILFWFNIVFTWLLVWNFVVWFGRLLVYSLLVDFGFGLSCVLILIVDWFGIAGFVVGQIVFCGICCFGLCCWWGTV